MKLVLASQNRGKLKELAEILGDCDVEVVLQSDLGIHVDVEETGTTFLENAQLKAQAVMEASGLPAIADDSGLVVDALDGAPGIYSARYGNCNSDTERTTLLLRNMEDKTDRNSHFACAIVAVFPDGSVISSEGKCHGKITREPMGEDGFGYDPIFYYPAFGKTFAQMNSQEKNKISHRKVALTTFMHKLRDMKNHDI